MRDEDFDVLNKKINSYKPQVWYYRIFIFFLYTVFYLRDFRGKIQ